MKLEDYTKDLTPYTNRVRESQRSLLLIWFILLIHFFISSLIWIFDLGTTTWLGMAGFCIALAVSMGQWIVTQNLLHYLSWLHDKHKK